MSSINDKNDWKTVQKALAVIDLRETDIEVSLESLAIRHYHKPKGKCGRWMGIMHSE